MGLLKDKKFWVGVAVGVFVVPLVMNRLPGVTKKLPSGG